MQIAVRPSKKSSHSKFPCGHGTSPGAFLISIPKRPAKMHRIPAKPARPKPGIKKISIPRSMTPKMNIATSSQFAIPMRYLLPTMMMTQMTATSPGKPRPGVFRSTYTPSIASITRTAITTGELIHRTISSDQFVFKTTRFSENVTLSRSARNERAPSRFLTTVLAIPYSIAFEAVRVNNSSLLTTNFLFSISYVMSSVGRSFVSKNSYFSVSRFFTWYTSNWRVTIAFKSASG